MNRLTKSFALDKEEYKMGIKSKAQLEVSEDEYNYKLQNSALQMESLRHDSAVTLIRKDLLKNDLEREQKKFTRSLERMNNLVVTAPIAGQPATINYQGKRYPLKITKVVPEVKDRMFDVDLIFTGEMPDNVRVGKSFRVQIELGQPEQAIVIPRGNFYQVTGGQWVYKVNASKTKAIKVPLTIGRQNPQQYEITEGLQPGELVVVTGYDTFGDAEELILK